MTKALNGASLPELSYEYAYGPDGLARRETRTVYVNGNPVASYVERDLDEAGKPGEPDRPGLSGFQKTATYSAPGFGKAVPGVTGTASRRMTYIQRPIGTAAATRLGLAALAYGNGQATTYSYDNWLVSRP